MEGKKPWGNAVTPTHPWVMGLLVFTPGPGDGGEASGRMASFSATEPFPLSCRCVRCLLGGTRCLFTSIHGAGEQLLLMGGLPARERSLQLKPLQLTPYAEWLINVPDLPRDCVCPTSRPA